MRSAFLGLREQPYFVSVGLVRCSVFEFTLYAWLVFNTFFATFCMQIRYNNVPYVQFLADKGGGNWIKQWKDTLKFPGGDIQSSRGAHQYLDLIGGVSN